MKILKILTFVGLLVLLIFVGSMIVRIYYYKPTEIVSEKSKKDSVAASVQINILNGTKITGIASQARIFIREKGIDVVEIGNFQTPVAVSYIIDRVGDFKASQKVARAIGIKDSLITEEIDSALFLKCSLILGEDYKKLKPFKNE